LQAQVQKYNSALHDLDLLLTNEEHLRRELGQRDALISQLQLNLKQTNADQVLLKSREADLL
jgi:hypothetical protein